jgi:hypothetical protein
MLPTGAILRHYSKVDTKLLDIILELRNLIVSAAPYATEEVQRNGLVFFDAARGGHVSAGICQIGIYKDHIRLAFVHGAFLHDPKGLLQGDRKYKKYVKICSFEETPWEDLKELITASKNFDPYSLLSE